MRDKKGISLTEVIVVIITIILLTMIVWSMRSKVRVVSKQIVCHSKLKGIGQAMMVYADDSNGNFPELPGEGPWSKELGFAYDDQNPDFTGRQKKVSRTVTASWYLLIRYSDLSPKTFVCPETKQQYFEGLESGILDVSELWDFGFDPYNHVSYSMHNPYGKFPANINKPSGFSLAADMNPWFKEGDILPSNENENLPPQIIDYQDDQTYALGNSTNHTEYQVKGLFGKKTKHSPVGLGQNVLYIDGSVIFRETPNYGIKNDNIYTFWSNEENPAEQDIQGGTPPSDRSPENDAKSKEDSFLVL